MTARNPKVVISQNIVARKNEFPKKAMTFFEKPSKAPLKPVYILQLIASSPVRQAILIFFFFMSLEMEMSSTLSFLVRR